MVKNPVNDIKIEHCIDSVNQGTLKSSKVGNCRD